MPAQADPDLSLAQAAKLIKIALTTAFAGVAFSVRSSNYANGGDFLA
jgi:hypothetical protein